MYQDDLLNEIERDFGNYLKDFQKYDIPVGTNDHLKRPSDNDKPITKENQTKYRSGVGILLYLVKNSRPDLANSARKLSKMNDKATPAHWKRLLSAIKFALDTKNKVLQLKMKDREK